MKITAILLCAIVMVAGGCVTLETVGGGSVKVEVIDARSREPMTPDYVFAIWHRWRLARPEGILTMKPAGASFDVQFPLSIYFCEHNRGWNDYSKHLSLLLMKRGYFPAFIADDWTPPEDAASYFRVPGRQWGDPLGECGVVMFRKDTSITAELADVMGCPFLEGLVPAVARCIEKGPVEIPREDRVWILGALETAAEIGLRYGTSDEYDCIVKTLNEARNELVPGDETPARKLSENERRILGDESKTGAK